MQDMTTDTPVQAPGLLNLALEARAPFEYAASLLAAPWLLSAPRGDGHAVIVYPGFLASDFSTRPLRRLLRTLGHDVHGWEQGRNVGARTGTLERALEHLRQTHRASGRRVSLVGWSLGGLYARELAKMAPDSVRIVVTLGSPFTGPPQATNAFRLYQWLHRDHGPAPRLPDELTVPPPQPCTSIYSRSDGVVAWPCSLQRPGPQAENIEVPASHAGLGVNPVVLYALADRLAQPEGDWRPFTPRGRWRRLYPS